MAPRAKTALLVAVAATCFSQSTAAASDDDYEWGKFAWENGDFVQANVLLSRYRTRTDAARASEVDYMIGTSWCRLPGMREKGNTLLSWLAKRTDVGEAIREQARTEWQTCASAGSLPARPVALGKGAQIKAQGDNRPVKRNRLPS